MTETNDIKARNGLIHKIGHLIAEHMPNFFGKITLNIKGGRYINSNIEESIAPDNTIHLSKNCKKVE